MSTDVRTLTQLSTAELVAVEADPMPVTVLLRWRSDDPFALELVFQTGRRDAGDVTWWIGRELLDDCFTVGEAGRGDVRMWLATVRDHPDDIGDEHLCLELSSPSGHALVEFSAPDLDAFLTRTFEAVPPGCEMTGIDLDAEIAALVEGARDET